MAITNIPGPTGLPNAYRAVLADVMGAMMTAEAAQKAAVNRVAALERRNEHLVEGIDQRPADGGLGQKVETLTAELAGLTRERDELLSGRDRLSTDLTAEKSRVTALQLELQESDRLRAKAQELYDRAKIERGEQSTKVVELQQALKEAREAQPSASADVSQVEKQLTATIGKLRAAEETAREAQKRTAEVEKELAETREANLALSEQAARVADLEKALADAQTTTPAGSVDLSAVRRYVEVAMKHFDADDPTKTAHALAAAAQELNRLEEK